MPSTSPWSKRGKSFSERKQIELPRRIHRKKASHENFTKKTNFSCMRILSWRNNLRRTTRTRTVCRGIHNHQQKKRTWRGGSFRFLVSSGCGWNRVSLLSSERSNSIPVPVLVVSVAGTQWVELFGDGYWQGHSLCTDRFRVNVEQKPLNNTAAYFEVVNFGSERN